MRWARTARRGLPRGVRRRHYASLTSAGAVRAAGRLAAARSAVGRAEPSAPPRACGARREGLGRELALGLRRKALVLLPFLPHFLLLLRRQLLQRLVLLARRLPAVAGESCAHAPICCSDALLLVGRHLRIALRDPAPLLLALRVQLVPVGGERGEHLLFGSGRARPTTASGCRSAAQTRSRPRRPRAPGLTREIASYSSSRASANSGIPGPGTRRSAGPRTGSRRPSPRCRRSCWYACHCW